MINDTWIRLGVFITVLTVMMVWESTKPNRLSAIHLTTRWLCNFTLMVLGALLARLIVPTGLASIAIFAQHNQLGLCNQVSLPVWLSVLISVVLFDCLIYWQHRLFHLVPMLWRDHKVHHADPHLDASTGLRFHPLEIALSLLIKVAAVLLMGAPVVAILIFEILLNATSIFSHSNIKLPIKIDHLLQKVIVTQAMHRIHHSQLTSESNSNFGFNLSVWDRLFGSYISNAKTGDSGIKLGLTKYASEQSNAHLKALLLMPFKGKPD